MRSRACPGLCITLILGALLRACRPLPDLPERPAQDGGVEAQATVALEPAAELDRTPPVVRIHVVAPAAVALDPVALALYEGELSSYHLSRITRRELPMTLLERVVPAEVWTEPGGLVVAPSRPLVPGELYSLASPELGLIALLRGGPHTRAFYERFWPPVADAAGALYVVLCADAAAPPEPAELMLDPGQLRAELRPGVAVDAEAPGSCVHIQPEREPAAGSTLVLPPVAAEVALDPAPLHALPAAPAAPASCASDERPFGPGCLLVLDDRLVLRSGKAGALWVVRTRHSTEVERLSENGRLVARGLEPNTAEWLWATIIDLNGSVSHVTDSVVTLTRRPHLVLNEVLADPVGPEPAQEWIELVNDGAEEVSLEGFVLEDLGGQTELPARTIAAGAHALVVQTSFSESSPWDVLPAPGTTLLRVPALGKDGLSNLGEPLSLRAPDGSVVSRFPPLPRPKPGRSVARRKPDTPDDAADGFALHAEPGASPGAPNRF